MNRSILHCSQSKQFLTAGTVSFSSSDTVLIWLKSVRLLLHELLLEKKVLRCYLTFFFFLELAHYKQKSWNVDFKFVDLTTRMNIIFFFNIIENIITLHIKRYKNVVSFLCIWLIIKLSSQTTKWKEKWILDLQSHNKDPAKIVSDD